MAVSLEPFPMFVDYAPADSANYFTTSKISSSLRVLSPSRAPKTRKPRVSISDKVSNYVRLRYYQYEVTFGLFMMTPVEKMVFNGILLVFFATLLYALYWGLHPFIVQSICRLVYLATGSFSSAEACNQ